MHAPSVQCASQCIILSLCNGQKLIVFHTRCISSICPVWNIDAATNLCSAPKCAGSPTRHSISGWSNAVGNSHSSPSLVPYISQSSSRKTIHSPAIHDSCFLYTKNWTAINDDDSSPIWEFTCIQSDDTASRGNSSSITEESKMASRLN